MKSHHKVSATLVGNVLAEMAVGLKKKEKLEIEKVPFSFFLFFFWGWGVLCVFLGLFLIRHIIAFLGEVSADI